MFLGKKLESKSKMILTNVLDVEEIIWVNNHADTAGILIQLANGGAQENMNEALFLDPESRMF